MAARVHLKAAKYLASGSMQQKSSPRLEEYGSVAELATFGPEHPSPVSVLDVSAYIFVPAYRDDAASPVKQLPNAFQGNGAEDSNHSEGEDQWNPADKLDSMESGLTSEINRMRLKNIENLVQKLRRLNYDHDEARTDCIASLCEYTNPDHRYISEILLASGLLLRDLGSRLTTFQLHPSGHPINPELFYVLEQTKASSFLAKEECKEKEKSHRKLIFDAVNEILVHKLDSAGIPPVNERANMGNWLMPTRCSTRWPNEAFWLILWIPLFENPTPLPPVPRLKPDKLAKKTLNAQKLLKELSSEIEQLQGEKPECGLEDKDDGLKNILWEDVVQTGQKAGQFFDGDTSGVVLDVERLIFKDLVNEIVIGEAAASSRAKQLNKLCVRSTLLNAGFVKVLKKIKLVFEINI